MNFSQKFISSLLFTILLTSPLGSAVVLANTKAWVNPNCYENPLLDCDCTNDEKGKLIADKVSAGCVEIDTGTPLFVQKLASGVTQTPCTPTDTNTETCVRNPEVMWTPWNECSQRSQEAAAEREPSADEIATPVAG
ncbi:MAG: hypothetical protein U9Q15_00105 [Patescibacteria group bacterium]|nr:hypothetical protein [Patescibacteria group bacterium]